MFTKVFGLFLFELGEFCHLLLLPDDFTQAVQLLLLLTSSAISLVLLPDHLDLNVRSLSLAFDILVSEVLGSLLANLELYFKLVE